MGAGSPKRISRCRLLFLGSLFWGWGGNPRLVGATPQPSFLNPSSPGAPEEHCLSCHRFCSLVCGCRSARTLLTPTSHPLCPLSSPIPGCPWTPPALPHTVPSPELCPGAVPSLCGAIPLLWSPSPCSWHGEDRAAPVGTSLCAGHLPCPLGFWGAVELLWETGTREATQSPDTAP